ncbi:hypothetical protein HLH10_07285 [Acinetobacter sp. ANC 4277]|uniref:hypothetical protein n=1 Tax=Acinetobacter terrae TaxID=2731247 RepID=UPI0014903E97|nr:hypothetical protein [Acinetobacter terrae]NNG76131.1 hypothetical protein [Acinetobacter terrae]
MNKKQKTLLKTACLTRTQMFIEQEFDYFNLLKEHSELLDDLKKLNEIVLNLFLKKSWSAFETDLKSSLRKAEEILKLNFETYLEGELIACFWGNMQYGKEFKNPIQNRFNLNLTQQFHLAYTEIFLLIRKNAEYSALYENIQKLASGYDLASLCFRMQLDRDKYLILIYLELSIGLQTLEYREDNLQDYYLLIHLLTPSDTLRRGANSVSLKPTNHLSFGDLKGRNEGNQLVEIQEGILYFQLPVGKSYSFHQVLFSNFYALYLLLNKNLMSQAWDHIEELEEILEFLSKKLMSKKNAHQKEKSTLVDYEALILEYFCLFKKAQYCASSISEPNGFNKFLYDSLKSEDLPVSTVYRLAPLTYREGIKSVDLEFSKAQMSVSFSHESIRKKLERRKKSHKAIILLTPEISISQQSHEVDFSDIQKNVRDDIFIERYSST